MDESGPSWTARRVAAHRLDFSRVPAPYGDAAAYEVLAADVAGELRVTEGRMHDYLAARTAFFDRIVLGALDGGIRQVVVGGAGYDGRALRYAKPGVRWFEVDHPATQADKRERLDRLGLAAAHVRFEDPEAAARHRRLRSAGLLTASAGPRTPPNTANQKPRAPQQTQEPQTPRRARWKGQTQASPVPPSADPLSLSALLSQALVAFTIESDNEAEHRMPHRTQNYGPSVQGDGAWLVSMAMYENCLRFVGEEPITVAELERLARTPTNLDGMRRWGYITIDGTARKIHKTRPGSGAVLRATPRGLQARQVWTPIAGLTEQRWRERFGADQVGRLKDALRAVVARLDPGLPDCLPILGANLASHAPDPPLPLRPDPADPNMLSLSALLSRVLLSFTLDYERESALSLAASANLLRVLNSEGTRLRDLPALSGVSKEAVSWALGVLVRAGLAVEEPDPAASRGKVARLTPRGIAAQRAYRDLLGTIEGRWRERFGADQIAALMQALEAMAIAIEGHPPPLFGGLEPYPDGWRARIRPPGILPYFPMVLHRGGYPDGS